MEELMRVMDLLMMVSEETNQLDYGLFGGFWCMVLEEYCRSNQMDIKEVSRNIIGTIDQVQEELGEYY